MTNGKTGPLVHIGFRNALSYTEKTTRLSFWDAIRYHISTHNLFQWEKHRDNGPFIGSCTGYLAPGKSERNISRTGKNKFKGNCPVCIAPSRCSRTSLFLAALQLSGAVGRLRSNEEERLDSVARSVFMGTVSVTRFVAVISPDSRRLEECTLRTLLSANAFRDKFFTNFPHAFRIRTLPGRAWPFRHYDPRGGGDGYAAVAAAERGRSQCGGDMPAQGFHLHRFAPVVSDYRGWK